MRIPPLQPRSVILILVVAALVTAWSLRFLQDDAFISFHYARNLVEGRGLTWFGERIEGYTNFLWVLWIAVGLQIGVDAGTWAHVGGLAAWVAALLATARLARQLSPSFTTTVVALTLLATNYSFASYATGGLETMLQTALLAWILVLAIDCRTGTRPPTPRTGLALSLLLAAALLTRLDSAVVGGVSAAFAAVAMVRRPGSVPALIALLVPAAALVGAWLAWKGAYYGQLLPNTFHAKVGDHQVPNGLLYVGRFLHWYLLWPLLVVGTGAAVLRRRPDPALTPVVAALAAWLGYVVWVGGDFMEFRFLVPIAPPLCALLAHLLHDALGVRLLHRPRATVAVALLTAVSASAVYASRPWGTTADLTLDSIPQLAHCYGLVPDGDWDRLGDALRRDFDGLDVLLAMHPVGAIPYASRIPTVDMWGLNDAVVATSGNPVPADFHRPGHRRHASLDYLRRRRVTFILGHPVLVPPRTLANPASLPSARAFPGDAVRYDPERTGRVTLVELPIDSATVMVAWYLTPTPAVDARIRAGGWATVTFER